MSSTIKQQPCSPVSYETFPKNFYNHHHHHRQSTTSVENEQLSPISNNNGESSSTSALVRPSTTDGGDGGGGWYEKRKYSNYLFGFKYLRYCTEFNILSVKEIFRFILILKFSLSFNPGGTSPEDKRRCVCITKSIINN